MTVGDNAEGVCDVILDEGDDGVGVRDIMADGGNGCICVCNWECLFGAGSQ